VTERARARQLLDRLEASAPTLRERGWNEVVRILGRVGRRFLDPNDPFRREAEARIPDEAGYSEAMARTVVEGMARDWTAERLRTLVRADFPDPGVLDGFCPGPEGTRIRALGPDLGFHVGAGSVPGVTATSLIRSLLVKTPVLVKPGAGDRALPELFVRGIEEEDEALARSVEVAYWKGGEGGALEEEALARAGVVVVYGGTETVQALEARLPPGACMVAYSHRVSVGLVGRAGFGDEGRETASPAEATTGTGRELRRIARDAALAVATFDQRGCVSPHVIWVEEGGEVAPAEFARLLGEALEALESELPSGPLPRETASEVQQLRGIAELKAAGGSEDRVFAGSGGSWTVLFEPDPAFAASCLGRTVRVKPVPGLEKVPELLRPYRTVLQSAALEGEGPPRGEGSRREGLSEALARVGVIRVTTFREQPWPPAWWRHDGRGPLEVLVRRVSLEG
jgi:hypothetical protein